VAEEANPGVRELLAEAVSGISGAERPGQVTMAEAVWDAMRTGEHLAVQAGTGTGKSLAYLVPAFLQAVAGGGAVVVSTATIALQRQLVDRDLPRLAKTLSKPLGREPEFAILKGRRNYLCKAKVGGAAHEDDGQDALFEPTSMLGRQVKRLHEWAGDTETGDRDELVPGVSEQAWRQVSVSARECVGANKCPFGPQCFAEKAKRKAGESDIVVTNHALLAIDAISEGILPEHQVVIVDEAHELVDRVTSVATGELSSVVVDMAQRRCARILGAERTHKLTDAGNALGTLLQISPAGRMDSLDEALAASLAALRDAASEVGNAIRSAKSEAEAAAAQAAEATLEELYETADRVLDAFGPGIAERDEVVWVERPEDGQPSLYVAPLEVSELLAGELFSDRTVVLTSATLTLGGSFDPLARQWGLAGEPNWSAVDVGSPFDHPKSGILYVAKHLADPGREGLSDEYLQEMWELIKAAGGRTLGLFSSMRAAKQATAALRDSLKFPLLCQGDDSTGLLVKQFAEDEETCLFGTLSLWQGVDVPGRSLSLVIIDRIPFPRPDDPLASARTRAAGARGGNGFMEVSATHAALLLAQGAGRLLRSMSDRGVVAVLDPRLVTKRYGDFLRTSLPPFWTTTDPEVVRGALRRLTGTRTT
jgi:ATP-dependent DNA helicase DinG